MVRERPGKILVIDDDSDFREYARQVLEQEGHEVLLAADGAMGLELARSQQPEVVIVDLLMVPDDGFATCEHLRAWPETRHVAILVVSAIERKMHKQFASADVGARLDANGYLTKPVPPRELTQGVARLLQFARARRSGACGGKEEP